MNIIKQIIGLYGEVTGIYTSLCELELQGLTKSDEFLKLINRLKEILKEEDTLLEQLYNSNEYSDAYNYVSGQKELIFKRLLDYMKRYEILNDEIYEDDDDEIKKEVQEKKLRNICMRNIYLVYLSFLQESINKDGIARGQLLRFKYDTAFIIRNMESMLVDNGFMVGYEVVTDLYFEAGVMNISMGFRRTVIGDTVWDIIESALETMLSISDNERDCCEEKFAVALNAECMFRTCLAILSDDDYKRIKKKIIPKIEELSMDSNIKGVGIVSSYIENRKYDKCRVRKVSSGNIAN